MSNPKPRALHVAPLFFGPYDGLATSLDGLHKVVINLPEKATIETHWPNWEDAKKQLAHTADLCEATDPADHAEHWFRQIRDRFQQYGRPQVVKLTDYETEADLRFLKPEQDWTLTYHRMVNHYFGRHFRQNGIPVEQRMVRMVEYMDWLTAGQRPNNPASRAQYIAGG